jgi:hypothetical protein
MARWTPWRERVDSNAEAEGASVIAESAILDVALDYGRRGWCVLPLHTVINGVCSCWRGAACRSAGKHPIFDTGEDHAAATTDLDLIREWWARWRDANVGIVTGAASGLVVLDVDVAKGGFGSLAAMFPKGPPRTLSVETGSGGLHRYHVHPGGRVPCHVGFRPGLDLRGDGGLVVAPPSRHKSGGPYLFITASRPIAPMPPELIAALAPVKVAHRSMGQVRPFRGTLTPYAAAALEREAAEVATHPPKTGRHVRLFAAAAALGEMIASGMLPRSLVEYRLREACDRNGMTAEGREREIEKAIACGIAKGMLSPRVGPAPPWESRPQVTEWDRPPEVTSWKS